MIYVLLVFLSRTRESKLLEKQCLALLNVLYSETVHQNRRIKEKINRYLIAVFYKIKKGSCYLSRQPTPKTILKVDLQM